MLQPLARDKLQCLPRNHGDGQCIMTFTGVRAASLTPSPKSASRYRALAFVGSGLWGCMQALGRPSNWERLRGAGWHAFCIPVEACAQAKHLTPNWRHKPYATNRDPCASSTTSSKGKCFELNRRAAPSI